MTESAMLYVTFPTQEEAERVAESIIAERLVACANIQAPCTSLYHWEGKIERSTEIPVFFKTRMMIAERLRARIEELHSYDVPIVEFWPVRLTPKAAEWIVNETR